VGHLLPLRTKLAFGVGASAEGAINVAFNTWNFLFYNQVLGLSGTLAGLAGMGAVVTTPGCGPCCGTSGPIPGDGMTVVSTANRNFKGRMGTASAAIYLASPIVCAAAAAAGRFVDLNGHGV